MAKPSILQFNRPPSVGSTRRDPSGYRSVSITPHGLGRMPQRMAFEWAESPCDTSTVWVLPDPDVVYREVIA
jgi:hypothetical protein